MKKGIHKFMTKLIVVMLMAISILPAGAQNRDDRDYRDNRDNQTFYNGVRSGGRGGQYSDPRYNGRYNNGQYDNGRYDNGRYDTGRYDNGRYDNGQYRNDRRNQGGIGPGKGALIGGAGGAVLGALFGKGVKGAIIGGAAGAGIGAVIGEAHQNDVNRDYDRR
jgi:hypothetical protein